MSSSTLKRNRSLTDILFPEDDNDNDDEWILVKGKGSKKLRGDGVGMNFAVSPASTSSQQPNQLILSQQQQRIKKYDEAINSVIEKAKAGDSLKAFSVEHGILLKDIDVLQKKVTDLTSTVRQQHSTINKLTNQLNFVLSYLGIDSSDVSPGTVDTAVNSVDVPSQEVDVAGTIPSYNVPTSVQQFSSVVKSGPPVMNSTRRLRNDLKHDFISAVYVDQGEKKRRTKNIIIKNFPPISSTASGGIVSTRLLDKDNVGNFLRVEFQQSNFEITGCLRVGKVIAGSIQPLLVNCRTAEQAKYFIDNAKQLRNSPTEIARSIYMSPDLTKAECKAAYDLRYRRRSCRPSAASAALSTTQNDRPGHLAETMAVTVSHSSAAVCPTIRIDDRIDRHLIDLSATVTAPTIPSTVATKTFSVPMFPLQTGIQKSTSPPLHQQLVISTGYPVPLPPVMPFSMQFNNSCGTDSFSTIPVISPFNNGSCASRCQL